MSRRNGLPQALGATLAVALLAASPVAAQAPGPTYSPAPQPYKPAPDKKAPTLIKVKLTPKAVRAKSRITLTFTLDEPARVAGVVTLRSIGVRTRGRRCVARTRGRHGPPCPLRTRAGRVLAARANRGVNRARLNLSRLAPGRYTLTLTPTDPSGNVGRTRAVQFTVKA
jgi:hypothetical protein